MKLNDVKYLILILLFLSLSGCATLSVKKPGCEAEYGSLFKDVNGVSVQVCGSSIGVSRTEMSEDVLNSLKEIIKIKNVESISRLLPLLKSEDTGNLNNLEELLENEDVKEWLEDTVEKENNKPAVEEPEANSTTKLGLTYHGKTNGGRPTWYTSAENLQIGDIVKVVIGDFEKEFTVVLRDNGSIGFEEGEFVVKNSEVSGRYIAVLLPSGYSGPIEPAYITINK